MWKKRFPPTAPPPQKLLLEKKKRLCTPRPQPESSWKARRQPGATVHPSGLGRCVDVGITNPSIGRN